MESIFEDSSIFNLFTLEAHQIQAGEIKLGVLDWHGDPPLCSSYDAVPSELHRRPVPRLRIILAPLDLPRTAQSPSLLDLCRHYSVPSVFLEERIRSVTHSFGAVDNNNGYSCSWFHYLCKNITVQKHGDGGKWVSDPRPGMFMLPHMDGTWNRSGFFLRWASPGQANATPHPEVTLICFQAPEFLRERLLQIPAAALCRGAALDPHCLFVVILTELSRQMDHTTWDLSDVFGDIETKMLAVRHERESFTGLHNIFKHIIFLLEGSEAVSLTLKAFELRHQTILGCANGDERAAMQATHNALLQVETGFQAVNLRLKSLEKRMQNIISLACQHLTPLREANSEAEWG